MSQPSNNARTRHRAALPTPTQGRPAKFGTPVKQMSVHLIEEQRLWIERFAAQRSHALKVTVSRSDIVRLAVTEFMSNHAKEADASNASD